MNGVPPLFVENQEGAKLIILASLSSISPVGPDAGVGEILVDFL